MSHPSDPTILDDPPESLEWYGVPRLILIFDDVTGTIIRLGPDAFKKGEPTT